MSYLVVRNSHPNIAVIWPTEGPMEAFHNEPAFASSPAELGGETPSDWHEFIEGQMGEIHYPDALKGHKNPSDVLEAQFNFVNDFIVEYGREFMDEQKPSGLTSPVLAKTVGQSLVQKLVA